MPSHISINGVIDIYHGDDVSSFETVKSAGILGIIHKATQGVGYTDPEYAARKPEALKAGLLWGAYHFGTNSESGKEQADYFLSVVNPGPDDLLALDYEQEDGHEAMTLDKAVDFVETVYQATGRYPGFYSGSLIREQLGNNTNETLAKCWLWWAEYGPEAKIIPNWKDWTMWQYTGDGIGPEPHTVDGVSGEIDRDKFNGDEAALRKLWTGGASAPPPAPTKPTPPKEEETATGDLTLDDFSTDNDLTQIDSAGEWPIYKVNNTDVIAVKAKMDIDADGSPHAYEPNNQGLDVNIDAKDGSEWVGVATDSHGNPVIQGPDDPAPGYYISTTSLEDTSQPTDSTKRYLDSETVPYIVIPHSHDSVGWELGDLATVIRLKDGAYVHAIVGDIGPKSKFGEASIAVAKALGVNPSARVGGDQENHFGYLIYNGSAASPAWPRSSADINESADALYKKTVSQSMIDGLQTTPSFDPGPPPPPKEPLIVFSDASSDEAKSLQTFLNQFPGESLDESGIPDANTSARLAQFAGITLKGAPDGNEALTPGPFVVYDPHNKTDYTRLFQTWLSTFDGVDVEADGFAGQHLSDAVHTVFGSYLPGDSRSGGGSATALIPFDPHHYSQYALRLQTMLNDLPGIQIGDDGYAGDSTSEAAQAAFGNPLPFSGK